MGRAMERKADKPESVKLDGFKVTVGDKLKVRSRHGTQGKGHVIGFLRSGEHVSIRMRMGKHTIWGHFDYFPKIGGGFYDRILVQGVAINEIER